ncbi:hypothetical protein SLEP1_g11296 [Rubroshorea leprosula]|uniref:Uncharacterized protein n=1 Tax=Rubroshorea leprosula TaxID=152421 RepID=A0AAV5IAV5_9ROSI|nr:hypothetical protein SLEP1_g11296 [Rubroshorea leprosula]
MIVYPAGRLNSKAECAGAEDIHPARMSTGPLQIKQDDKFFSRLMSKEASAANSSARVYYGGARGAVPFVWELQPGTPKHPSADTTLPPLTPPPSYYSNSKLSMHEKNRRANAKAARNFISYIFPKRKKHEEPSWSSSTCGWPLASSMNSKFQNKHGYPPVCTRASVDAVCGMDEEQEEGYRLMSPTSTLRCFGAKVIKCRSLKNGFPSCYSKS